MPSLADMAARHAAGDQITADASSAWPCELHELLSPGNATLAAADIPSSKHALVHDAKLQDARGRANATGQTVHTS